MVKLRDGPHGFLNRDKDVGRREKDIGDSGGQFWHAVSVAFCDPKNKFKVRACGGHDLSKLEPEYSGYILSSEKAKEFFTQMRTLLDKSLAKFECSGNGDGGEEPGYDFVTTTCTSNFFSFCNGNLPLYYMYYVFTQQGMTQSAASKMNKGGHDCEVIMHAHVHAPLKGRLKLTPSLFFGFQNLHPDKSMLHIQPHLYVH